MSLWIKICGNTSLADAQFAADAGADAVGFVFAPSPRRVSVAEVAAITPLLPSSLEKIGVFVGAGFEEICAAIAECGLTGVQLHFDAPADLPWKIRERVGSALRILHVLHFDSMAVDSMAEQLAGYAQDPHLDGVLVDSRTAAAMGGTGRAFDWVAARKTIFAPAGPTGTSLLKLIVAGGLHAENVGEAIATLRPWGVDVVSGVEAEPGRKDAAKVRAFVSAARAAQSRLSNAGA